jgi:hypothetical protein
VAQVILFGGGRTPGEAGMAMPAFGEAYSDAEIAAAANYVTERFGAAGSRLTAENVASLRLTPVTITFSTVCLWQRSEHSAGHFVERST